MISEFHKLLNLVYITFLNFVFVPLLNVRFTFYHHPIHFLSSSLFTLSSYEDK